MVFDSEILMIERGLVGSAVLVSLLEEESLMVGGDGERKKEKRGGGLDRSSSDTM